MIRYEKTCQKSCILEFAYSVSMERLRSSRFDRAKIMSVFRSILEIRVVLEQLSQTCDSRKSCLCSADSVTSGQSVNFSATRSKVSTLVSVACCSVSSSLRTVAGCRDVGIQEVVESWYAQIGSKQEAVHVLRKKIIVYVHRKRRLERAFEVITPLSEGLWR